jgi:hypothetical protein
MQSIHCCTRWIIALVLGAVLFLPACSDNRSQDTSAKGSTSALQEQASPARVPDAEIDPCALVTSTEAAEVLGVSNVKMERPEEGNVPLRLETCLYSGERGEAVIVLSVMVRHGHSVAESTVGFEGMRETYAETVGVVDVPGIGDEAYWIEDLKQLWVLKGILQLGVSGDISSDKASELARKAVERLQ